MPVIGRVCELAFFWLWRRVSQRGYGARLVAVMGPGKELLIHTGNELRSWGLLLMAFSTSTVVGSHPQK